ncbi:hypothetical protein CHLNCDRAFT_25663 [Chlorella variabilis]|uniref:CENP-V/GFA domain-containing protein n=1 Tax=Chlorella variabilis TaxID=554065 RepID=E1ZKU8_CHLVA|nr:hypothetical protein CHLNCDRAFT_25663 [Chlorella variabilis]EFN53553.1 hypothetical protein CHLNCDRAFT_25663 [Chlorella variabilis]|eukprot:XP_005845655.1 hypothetical protein CHLNCDRAFT_25663 [Chlorella variabilis]
MELQGSCRCGAVKFSCLSQAPVPFMRCYCRQGMQGGAGQRINRTGVHICRKVSGCGGYAINIMAQADSLKVTGRENLKPYRLMLPAESGGALQPSTNTRFFCKECGCHLWAQDPSWEQWCYPFAGAIDTELPVPPRSVHMMLKDKAPWVVPQVGPQDDQFDAYPDLSIEEWHKKHKLWVE